MYMCLKCLCSLKVIFRDTFIIIHSYLISVVSSSGSDTDRVNFNYTSSSEDSDKKKVTKMLAGKF